MSSHEISVAFRSRSGSLLVVLFLIALPWLAPSFISRLNNSSYDIFQRIRPRVYQDAPIRIVVIDDESIEKIGQFPWSRSKIAELITKLQALQAKVIALDIVFSEQDRSSPKEIAKLFPQNQALAQVLSKLPDNDQVLIAALHHANVVTSFMLQETEKTSLLPMTYGTVLAYGNLPKLKLCYRHSTHTLAEIEKAAKGNGTVSYMPDDDGVVRSVPLFVCLQERLYPSLAMEAVRVFKQQDHYTFQSNTQQTDNVEKISLGDVEIQPSNQATVALYYSHILPERYMPAWKVLADEVSKQEVQDKIIFIGVSAKGLLDTRFSPLGYLMTGVEVHAQLAAQILQQSYLTRPVWQSFLTSLLLLLAWCVFSALQAKVTGKILALIGLLCIGVTIGSAWLAFVQARLLIDPIFPAFSLLLLWMVFFFQKQLKTEREKRWLRTAFGRYVSPNRVEYLIKHPDSLVLGGEYRECSFVMTDFAGFTALLEAFPPHECVAMINSYLDGMINIAFQYQGTIDRIVGDAVAVIFSAPIVQPDHCQRALACALAMDNYAMQFVSDKQVQGVQFGMTRIGVCTGKVLIGNFGSKTMFDYRALGDPINIAARLESVNKQFGTRICVAESTLVQANHVCARPIGWLILKGKLEKIKTFELLAETACNSSKISDYLAAYEKMEAEDASALVAFSLLAERYPDDGLIAYQYNRLSKNRHFVRRKHDTLRTVGSTIILLDK